MQTFTKVGLEALLTPDNCVLVLIDHQPFQLADVNSHEPTMVINNVTALAKTAKAFNIPTILTTVNEERGGLIFKTVQDVFPNQKPINRTFINAWEDKRVVDAVKKTGRKKLVIAALWSEMCLAMPAIHAMGDGYDVYVVTDASGGVSPEAHDMAIRRMVAAGAQPITWLGLAGELQRDWAHRQADRGGSDPVRSRWCIWISTQLGNATLARDGGEKSLGRLYFGEATQILQ